MTGCRQFTPGTLSLGGIDCDRLYGISTSEKTIDPHTDPRGGGGPAQPWQFGYARLGFRVSAAVRRATGCDGYRGFY